VRLALYDALGREVAVLVDRDGPAGAAVATLPAGRLSPGLYVVRLSTSNATAHRRLTILD
jgi:hypothetical protein